MFMVRSAFWLSLAFIMLHPQNEDIGAAAGALSARAMAAGQQMVVDRLLARNCPLLGCPATPATAPVRQTAAAPAWPATALAAVAAPYPLHRPAWLG